MTTPSFARGPFSEAQFREIIRRALQHDLRGYSESEIRRVAAELGISAGAIEAAKSDMGSSNLAAPTSLRLWNSIGSGALLGVASATTMPELLFGGVAELSGMTFGIMLLIALRVARICGRSAPMPVQLFLRRNFVMWGGFVIAGTAVARIFNPDWLGTHSAGVGLAVAALWAFSSGLGALVARYTRRPSEPGSPPRTDQASPSTLVARLKTLLGSLLERRHTDRPGSYLPYATAAVLRRFTCSSDMVE